VSPTVLAPVEIGSLTWTWSRTLVLGIVNVTPDSFSDGGWYFDADRAVEHGATLARAGADIVDVGGESTRPGSEPVGVEEELARVLPVVERLAHLGAAQISIDTVKARVAREAVRAGATVINDVSGGGLDPEILGVAAETGAVLVLGHLRGEPRAMQRDIHFEDVVREVEMELRARVHAALAAGVESSRIFVDPGLGFGKTSEQSVALLRATGRLREGLGYPVLVGPSRKSFIGEITGQPPAERLMGTSAAVAAAVISGVDAVRVHDVEELVPAIRVADAIRRGIG
jgi:dihydropteroate synthase